MIQIASHPNKKYLHTPRTPKGVVKRDVVIFAAFGLAILSMAFPAALVSDMRMAILSNILPAKSSPEDNLSSGNSAASTTDTEEIQILKRKLLTAEDERRRLLTEIDKLRSFKNIRSRADIELNRFISAEIISYSTNWQERSFIINRGRAHGVHLRAGVLAGNAVAGTIVEVGENISRVAMIYESDIKIASTTLHSRRSGLVVGQNGSCDLCYVPKWGDAADSRGVRRSKPRGAADSRGVRSLSQRGAAADSREVRSLPQRDASERPAINEPVMTSGRLGYFPKGFVIGHIASIGELPEALHLNIAIRPELNSSPTGQVWVFRPRTRD